MNNIEIIIPTYNAGKNLINLLEHCYSRKI